MTMEQESRLTLKSTLHPPRPCKSRDPRKRAARSELWAPAFAGERRGAGVEHHSRPVTPDFTLSPPRHPGICTPLTPSPRNLHSKYPGPRGRDAGYAER